jgi:hypothetical protein
MVGSVVVYAVPGGSMKGQVASVAVQNFFISHSQYNIRTLGCTYHYG